MEVQTEEDKKQPEDPTGVRDYFEKTNLSPNAARVHLPLYDSNIIAKNHAYLDRPLDIPTVTREAARKNLGIDERLIIHEKPMTKAGNDTTISSEPKQKTFAEQVEESRKRLEADSQSWKANKDFINRMMPENDWRDIPGFSHYEMNGLGTIRGRESKMERPLYVKLWRGGEDEVVIGLDALRAMTFGVKDG